MDTFNICSESITLCNIVDSFYWLWKKSKLVSSEICNETWLSGSPVTYRRPSDLEKPDSFTRGFNMQSNASPMWSDRDWMHLHLALNVFKCNPIVIWSLKSHVNAGVQEAWALLSDRWGHSYVQTVGQCSESNGQGSWHFIKLPTTGKSQPEKESATERWMTSLNFVRY